jgi:hypothetical protein
MAFIGAENSRLTPLSVQRLSIRPSIHLMPALLDAVFARVQIYSALISRTIR